MQNPRSSIENAAFDEVETRAISRATAPGQQSFGSGAAGIGGVVTNLVVSTPVIETHGLPVGVFPDEIGIDPDGNFWHPFYLGIDTPDDAYAYVPTGYPIYNFGR